MIHNPDDVKRFWQKVKRAWSNECWEWIGGRHDFGYGVCWFGKRLRRAHRISWELYNGPIPDGLEACHKCDNPPCVNPGHLFLGTHKQNGLDARFKNRTKQGINHWNAKVSEEDVQFIRNSYVRFKRNHQELASKFGLSVMQVRRIMYKQSWKHI